MAKRDAPPLVRQLGAAWSAIRNRLVAYEAAPEGSELRVRARTIHDLVALVGEYFVGLLRAAHVALGDALGITKASVPVEQVSLTEPLRALADAVGDYALQLIAVARDEPGMRDDVVIALVPIVEFRAAVGRRSGAGWER